MDLLSSTVEVANTDISVGCSGVTRVCAMCIRSMPYLATRSLYGTGRDGSIYIYIIGSMM